MGKINVSPVKYSSDPNGITFLTLMHLILETHRKLLTEESAVAVQLTGFKDVD